MNDRQVAISVTHPEIATEAHGWDPSTVFFNNTKLRKWKCSVCKEPWETSVAARIIPNRGRMFCPICPRIRKGTISLATEFPEIAKETDGWNPNFISSHSRDVKQWLCIICNGSWPASVKHRTGIDKTGCHWCRLRSKIPLSVSHPILAAEAQGWDASKVSQYGKADREWKCSKCAHIWLNSLTNRTQYDHECEKCGDKTKVKYLIYKGQRYKKSNKDNRLSLFFPELIKELVDKEIGDLATYASALEVDWKCSKCSHPWNAAISTRTSDGKGCSECSKTGFATTEPSYLYWIKGEQNGVPVTQFGISKDVKRRLQYHGRNGFKEGYGLPILSFEIGQDALNLETEIKRKLVELGIPSIKQDEEIDVEFSGFTESFRTELFPSKDLKDLLKKLNLSVPKNAKHSWVPAPEVKNK
jgi:hypothetical protein